MFQCLTRATLFGLCDILEMFFSAVVRKLKMRCFVFLHLDEMFLFSFLIEIFEREKRFKRTWYCR